MILSYHNVMNFVQTGIQTCINDVLSWTNSSDLMLSANKTEVMAFCTSSRLNLVDCDSVNIGGSNISFQTSVKYFGVKIDPTLYRQNEISGV